MKFLHTSDWQLGMSFPHADRVAEPLRQARLGAIQNLLALAVKEHVDFIVAAGNLFADNRISRETIEAMGQRVSASAVPIYLLPGRTDPLTADSPYLRMPSLFGGRVTILGDAQPLRIEGGTLYPNPVLGRSAAVSRVIPARDAADGIRIGIGIGGDDLDYAALGECGPPEPTDFGDENGVLVVDIAAPGAPPVVRRVAVNTYTWADLGDREIRAEADLARLDDQLNAMPNPLQTLVRVRLSGEVSQALLVEAERLEARHAGRFFLLRVENRVVPSADGGGYTHSLLRGMSEQVARTPAGGSPIEVEAARRALGKLALLARECGLS